MNGRKRLLGAAAPGVGGRGGSNLAAGPSTKYLRAALPAIDQQSFYRHVVDGGAPTPRHLRDGPAMEARIPWQEAEEGGPEAVARQRQNRLTRRATQMTVKVAVSFRVDSRQQAEERLKPFMPHGATVVLQSGAEAPKLALARRGEGGLMTFTVGLYKYATVYEATVTLSQPEGGEKVKFAAFGIDEEQARQLACYGAMHLLRDSAIVLAAPTVRAYTAALPAMLRLRDTRIDEITARRPVGGWPPAPLPPPQPVAPAPKPAARRAVPAAAAKKPAAPAKKGAPAQAQELSYIDSLLAAIAGRIKSSRQRRADPERHMLSPPTLIGLRGDQVGEPPLFSAKVHQVSLEVGRKGTTIVEVVFELGRTLRLVKACVSARTVAAPQKLRSVATWATNASAGLEEAAYQLALRLDDADILRRAPGIRLYAAKREQVRGLLASVAAGV